MKKIFAFVVLLFPSLVSAQSINTINDVTSRFTQLGNTFVAILISFSVIYIIWFTVRYLIAGGEDDRKKAGLGIMWGVVGLFVILSIWGLVNILRKSFITDTTAPQQTDINNINLQQIPQVTQ